MACLVVSHGEWNEWWSLKANKKLVFEQGEYWRLFTTSFVHGDLKHLLSNSFFLILLGHFVSSFYGPFIHPIATSIFGIAINAFVIYGYKNPEMGLVGASGILYSLWGFWATLYFFIQDHIHWWRRSMKVTIVGLGLFFPTSFEPQVSYLAHFYGFLAGVILGLLYWPFKKNYLRSFKKIMFKIRREPDWADEAENS